VITFAFERLADVMREPGVRDLVASHFYEISEDQDELAFNPDWHCFCGRKRRDTCCCMRRERTGNWWISIVPDPR